MTAAPLTADTSSADHTKVLAAALARHVTGDDMLLLTGDLGAGKTTFVQGLATALGVCEPVTSPTFTLAAQYRGTKLVLHHLDAYRLENLSELVDLDVDSLVGPDSAVCIEWGEVVADHVAQGGHLLVTFTLAAADAPDSRHVRFEAVGSSWQPRWEALAATLAEFGEAQSSASDGGEVSDCQVVGNQVVEGQSPC